MNIADALSGIRRLYIETAPFIYYVEDHPVYVDKMESVFQIVATREIEIITSVITLSETLTKPLKTGDQAVEQAYRRLLQQTQSIQLVTINVSIADQCAVLRAKYNLRTPDALHLSAAMIER